jgi:hypothetical protein
MFKKNLLALTFVSLASLSSAFATITSDNIKGRIKDIYEIAKSLTEQKVENQNIWDFVRSPYNFVKEESLEEGLINVCNDLLLQNLPIDQTTKVQKIKEDLIEYLKSFVAKGTDWQTDFNVAFIFDEMNPSYKLYFANPEGKLKTRKYNLKIWSVGAKVELAFRSHVIMIINDDDTPLNYYDSNQEFILDKGIDVSLSFLPVGLCYMGEDMRVSGRFALGCAMAAVVPGICAVFANIKDTSNKILIVGLVSGFSIGLSYVFGGKMTPVKE